MAQSDQAHADDRWPSHLVQLCMPGGACLSKFVPALRELRDAGEMLHMHTDVALCERLQPWAEVGTRHCHMQPCSWLTEAYWKLVLLVHINEYHVICTRLSGFGFGTWVQSVEGAQCDMGRMICAACLRMASVTALVAGTDGFLGYDRA